MARLERAFACLVVVGSLSLTLLLLYSTSTTSPGLTDSKRKISSRHKFPDSDTKQIGISSNGRARQRNLLKLPPDGQRIKSGFPQSNMKNNHLNSFFSNRLAFGFQQSNQGAVKVGDASKMARGFPFRDDFFFPRPNIMRPLNEISQSPWLKELLRYLSGYNYSREISLVTSNSKYTDVLLNWLISATVKSNIPAKSILIISLDMTIHRLLLAKQFSSILVPPRSLINSHVTFSQPFDEVMMTRLAVMRIINHFGHGFVMYDSDAVLLKDPQPLYDAIPHEDIIGSVGKIPYDLAAEWGITICIGVVLIRSSPRVETYWNSMKDVCLDSFDDQEKLNCGLKALGIDWLNNNSSYQDTTVTGVCGNRLRVSILPYDFICRQTTCTPESRPTLYIWHKGGQRSRRDKLVSAREGQTWFLKYQWEKIRNDLVGTKWLQSIAYYTVLHAKL